MCGASAEPIKLEKTSKSSILDGGCLCSEQEVLSYTITLHRGATWASKSSADDEVLKQMATQQAQKDVEEQNSAPPPNPTTIAHPNNTRTNFHQEKLIHERLHPVPEARIATGQPVSHFLQRCIQRSESLRSPNRAVQRCVLGGGKGGVVKECVCLCS